VLLREYIYLGNRRLAVIEPIKNIAVGADIVVDTVVYPDDVFAAYFDLDRNQVSLITPDHGHLELLINGSYRRYYRFSRSTNYIVRHRPSYKGDVQVFGYISELKKRVRVKRGWRWRWRWVTKGVRGYFSVKGPNDSRPRWYYVYGKRLSRDSKSLAYNLNYFINDHAGSSLFMFDKNGKMTSIRHSQWTPFGSGGSTRASEHTNAWRFQELFAGQNLLFSRKHEINENAKWEPGMLYNNGYRNYDPIVGRYNEVDPLGIEGGDLNMYRYVKGNPVVLVQLELEFLPV
jgi:RHS repeat-associated protein